MRNFQDIFETLKRSFISPFSICMTVPLLKVSLIKRRQLNVLLYGQSGELFQVGRSIGIKLPLPYY